MGSRNTQNAKISANQDDCYLNTTCHPGRHQNDFMATGAFGHTHVLLHVTVIREFRVIMVMSGRTCCLLVFQHSVCFVFLNVKICIGDEKAFIKQLQFLYEYSTD